MTLDARPAAAALGRRAAARARPDAAAGARGACSCSTGAEDTAQAIERLAVRGAPLIGVAAAYGLAMEVAREPSLGALERGAERLATCRPTARNLAWAVERVRAAALAAGPVRLAGAAREAAEAIQREDEAASAALAEHGADAARRGAARPARSTVMTHCNSGASPRPGAAPGSA